MTGSAALLYWETEEREKGNSLGICQQGWTGHIPLVGSKEKDICT